MAAVTRTCSRCGRQEDGPEEGMPVGWSFGVEASGRITYTCADCARANIRAIEGRLPEEYWDR